MDANFSSNMSPYNFEKMGPLDVLAAVASETYENEIISPDICKKKSEKKVKPRYLEYMSFKDIKDLPAKMLVETFSEVTSDELTKKYSYKCVLLPDKCAATYKSFGNEKKACEKIKYHLLSHLRQLDHEVGSAEDTTHFYVRSKLSLPENKHYGKSVKTSFRALQKRRPSLQVLHSNPSSRDTLGNTKHNAVSSKQKQNCCSTSVKPAKRFKAEGGQNTIHFSCNKNDYSLKNVDFEIKLLERAAESCTVMSSGMLDCDENNIERDEENFKPCCQDTKCVFLSEHGKTNTFCNNRLVDSCNAEDLVLPDPKTSDEKLHQPESFLLSTESKSLILFHDHTYAAFTEMQTNKIICEKKFLARSRKSIGQSCETAMLDYRQSYGQSPQTEEFENTEVKIKNESKFIIKTPPFPYVYVPLLPEISSIKEIEEDVLIMESNECLPNNVEHDHIKFASSTENRFDTKLSTLLNKYDTSGSVLECVENRVNMKPNIYPLKKEFSSTENNDENLENMQKFQREFALKCIQKLSEKKKKHVPESLICEICENRNFTAMATLIHHYRSHAGIKPFACNICNSTFTRQHSLNYHMLIHQNLSRFSCDFCKRTFRHPSHYKEHLRRHTGETPYHCTDCSSQFKTRNTFKRHLKTHHGKLLTAQGVEDLTAEEFLKYRTNSKSKKH